MSVQMTSSWITNSKWIPLKRTIRKMLRYCFGYDKWQDSPINERPYALWILKNIDSIISTDYNCCIVEVGCGLGDIISGLYSENAQCYGFDVSLEVIRAARFLHRKVSFEVGTIEDVELGEIDVFIMVNFTHNIPDYLLKKAVDSLKEKNKIGYFIIDTFINNADNYIYGNHDCKEIFGEEYCLIKKSRGFNASKRNRRYIEIWGRRDIQKR